MVYKQYKHIFYGDIDKYTIYMHYTAIRSLLLILSRFIGLPRFSYLPVGLGFFGCIKKFKILGDFLDSIGLSLLKIATFSSQLFDVS